MGDVSFGGVVVALLVSAMSLSSLAWAEERAEPIRLPVVLASGPGPSTVVVVEGDHLWKISARHLDAVWGRRALNEEISPYWRSVITLNTPHLRSGDPDLIYPGEVVVLPDPLG